MIKEVTVYTASAAQVLVSNNYYELYKCKEPILFPGSLFGIECNPEDRIEIQRWPVKQISRNLPNGATIDKFIAVDPELRDMLEFDVRVHMIERVSQLNSTISVTEKLYKQAENKLIDFGRQPWYKRVWLALRNQL